MVEGASLSLDLSRKKKNEGGTVGIAYFKPKKINLMMLVVF